MATTLNLTVSAVANSQSIANNTSQVDIRLTITTDGGTYNESGDTSGYITLDGVQIADLAAKKVYYNTTTELYSGRHTVAHNEDGSKSVSVKAGFDVNTSVRWIYADSVLTLPKIPRASTLTFPIFTMGTESEIRVSKAMEDYTNEITYRFGSRTDGFTYGEIADRTGDTVIKWTPPTDALAPYVPKDDVKQKGVFTVTTYDGSGARIGENTFEFEAVLPAVAVPYGEITFRYVSESVPQAWNELVKGESALHYTVDAEGSYGAAITECVFTFAGQAVIGEEGETAILAEANTFTPSIKLTDERGRTAFIDFAPITVQEYSPPQFSTLNVFRGNSSYQPANNGTYVIINCNATCSSVNGKNSVSVQMQSRLTSGSYSGSYRNVVNNSQNRFSDYSSTSSYVVEVVATDLLQKQKRVEVTIPTEAVAFHLRDGGNGAAFGTYAQQDGLTCAWDAEFQQDVSVGGALSANSITAADIIIGGKSLLDFLHPVGSYYWSDSATSPATLFGGTWVKVEGRFLLGSGGGYSVGATGGEAKHTLTVDEMPTHHHTAMKRAESTDDYVKAGDRSWGITAGDNASGGLGYATSDTGGSAPHNNMPPYYTTNIWRRTA